MSQDLIAKASVLINSPVSKVWEALINPEMIKKYLFGTEVTSDWKAGSPIIYKGIWNGKAYEDKGNIIEIIPQLLLKTSFWSALSGLTDTPENYKLVTYKLQVEKTGTKLTLTQDNNASQEEKNHSEQNWKMVLNSLKELLEK